MSSLSLSLFREPVDEAEEAHRSHAAGKGKTSFECGHVTLTTVPVPSSGVPMNSKNSTSGPENADHGDIYYFKSQV